MGSFLATPLPEIRPNVVQKKKLIVPAVANDPKLG
jgi:hypothetical protein